MEEIFEPKKNFGEVLKTYHQLAVALNTFEEGKEASIKELADRAKVHWNTAKKSLLFFDMIKAIIPKFELSHDLKFRVVEKPGPFEAVDGMFSSSEMRIIAKMMLCKAIDSKSARSLKEVLSPGEFEVLPKLVSNGYVNSIEGLYYLSRRGTAIGGLGLKKLIEAGISLPWQRTNISITKLQVPAFRESGFIAKPVYIHPEFERLSIADSEGWNLDLEGGKVC